MGVLTLGLLRLRMLARHCAVELGRLYIGLATVTLGNGGGGSILRTKGLPGVPFIGEGYNVIRKNS
jgi:hypothetical protein